MGLDTSSIRHILKLCGCLSEWTQIGQYLVRVDQDVTNGIRAGDGAGALARMLGS